MSRSDNKLLAALPKRDFDRLQPILRTVHLTAESMLPHCGHTRVYFPGTGLCSIINTMADGRAIEVACIGSEGVVGLPSMAGTSALGRNGFVQVGDGRVHYVPLILFERELARSEPLRELIDGFSHSFLASMIQAVACNQLHRTEERCCRWLLGAHDRLGRVRFELRVRLVARTMGVKNAEVAAIFAELEREGLITHDEEAVTILDAVGLRRRSCRCFDAMKQNYALTRIAAPRTSPQPRESARVIQMRPGIGTCTLCGSSRRVPHRDGHECIVALDEEITGLVRRTYTLRKYRAQLLAHRTKLYLDILKRSGW